MKDINLMEMHKAYKFARSLGYKKDAPVDYYTMAQIVTAAYTKGINDAMNQKKA